MLEFICPTCGSFNLEDVGCQACHDRAGETAQNASAA